MGIPYSGSNDTAHVVETGSLTATGSSAAVLLTGAGNISVWGTFVATVALERSFDGGVTWLNCSTDATGTSNSLTQPISIVIQEPENGVLYHLKCSSYTSGTISYRLSQ